MQEPSRTKARHGSASATRKRHKAMCINSQPRDTLPDSTARAGPVPTPHLAVNDADRAPRYHVVHEDPRVRQGHRRAMTQE
jgi:hypothetical protein